MQCSTQHNASCILYVIESPDFMDEKDAILMAGFYEFYEMHSGLEYNHFLIHPFIYIYL